MPTSKLSTAEAIRFGSARGCTARSSTSGPGPRWAPKLVARFDDHADAFDGERLYENQAVLVVKIRFGTIVEQQDFYLDTQRIVDFDRALTDRGVTAHG